MGRVRLWALAMLLCLPSVASASGGVRTVRAQYDGFNQVQVGPVHVGLGDICPDHPHDGCVRVKIRAAERAAEIRVLDSSGIGPVPFEIYNDVNRDGKIADTEYWTACGSRKLPVSGGTELLIAVQAGADVLFDDYGFPAGICATPPGRGEIVVTLLE